MSLRVRASCFLYRVWNTCAVVRECVLRLSQGPLVCVGACPFLLVRLGTPGKPGAGTDTFNKPTDVAVDPSSGESKEPQARFQMP
eukprot:6173457-Pleurochrysis_carterae.AAC.2